MNTRPAALVARLACCIVLAMLAAAPASAAFVTAPDNGFGTAEMPPTGEYYDAVLMQIIDGLPPGTTVEIDNPRLGSFSDVTEAPGGVFAGGTHSAYNGILILPMTGTGTLLGYSRTINMPLGFWNPIDPIGASPNIMDWDVRLPFAPVQSFDADFRRLQTQITGDPDFDLLRITAGGDFGMPSPGHTTLTDVGGGNWNVDSFFDITYRIDFVGRPGGPFSGRSGSTTGTERFQMGMPVPEPSTLVLAGLATGGLALCRRQKKL